MMYVSRWLYDETGIHETDDDAWPFETNSTFLRTFLFYSVLGTNNSYNNFNHSSDHFHDVALLAKDVAYLNRIVYGILFPVLVTFGFISNICNLITLTQIPKMHKIPYLFIRARAITDMIVVVLIIPFTIYMTKKARTWDNPVSVFYHAHLELWIINAFIGASTLYVVGLTIERYISVCKPFEAHSQKSSSKRALAVVIMLPFVSVAFHVSYYFDSVIVHKLEHHYNDTSYSFHYDTHTHDSVYFKIYLVFLEVLFRVGPTVVVVVLNILILVSYKKFLQKRSELTSRKHSASHHRQKEEERRLFFLLGGTSLLYIICTTPSAALSLIINDQFNKVFAFQLFRTIANSLELTNNAITFVIYTLFSLDFRKAFLQAIRLRDQTNVIHPTN
ncbi:putative G-protein coupled receptor AH9.1 [Tachypleus tridentatus]|uniref:putative G-protein coupled receptor AH9.1 n=1 Tax=Tachypleus tridentatus TaxID=6853 RepID=UPI003FD372C3